MISLSDRHKALCQRIANDAPIVLSPPILEKDWLITEMIAALSTLSSKETQLVFCGGTCLSQAYHIIDRMSEDVDFKIMVPIGISRGHKDRILSGFKHQVVKALQDSGFILEADSLRARNENSYIVGTFLYKSRFASSESALRTGIKLELTANTPLTDCAPVPYVRWLSGWRRDTFLSLTL